MKIIKHLSSLIIILSINYYIFAQPPNIQWQHCFGGSNIDSGVKVKQTPDEGYIVLCSTTSSDGDVTGFHGTSDVWLIRLDSIGDVLWKKCYGGTSGDMPCEVINKVGGGFVISAETGSTNGDVTGFHGTSDMWIVNTNDSGNIIWEKCFGGSGGEIANQIRQTFDGGYIISGISESSDGDLFGIPRYSQGDFWILKIDSLGTIQWQKCIGGNDLEYSCFAIQTLDSGFVILGSTLSTDGDMLGIPVSGMNAWAAKLNVNGNLIWKCPLVGTAGAEFGKSIIPATDGGFFIGASCTDDGGLVSGVHSNGIPDFWIVKIDSNGVFQWQKCLGGTSSDEISDICSTDDGGLAAIGYTVSQDGDVSGVHLGINSYPSIDYWVVKLDSTGNIQWQKCLGGSGDDYGASISQTNDGGLILTGSELTFNDGDVTCSTINNDDVWVVKLSASSGNQVSPVPNKDNLTICYQNGNIILDGLMSKQYTLILFDDLGNLILNVSSKSRMIQTGKLVGGVYFAQVIDGDQKIIKKIIIQ